MLYQLVMISCDWSDTPFLIVVKFLFGQSVALVSKSHLLGSLTLVVHTILLTCFSGCTLSFAFLRLHGSGETGHSMEVWHACLPNRYIHHALIVILLVILGPIDSLDVVIFVLDLLSWGCVCAALHLEKHVFLVSNNVHFLENGLLLLLLDLILNCLAVAKATSLPICCHPFVSIAEHSSHLKGFCLLGSWKLTTALLVVLLVMSGGRTTVWEVIYGTILTRGTMLTLFCHTLSITGVRVRYLLELL